MIGIGPQTVEAGKVLVIKPSASDPDDTELVYSVTSLPVGAVFDPETGFRWSPSEGQVGVHEVMFFVADPLGAQSSETVTITVSSGIKVPLLTLLSSGSVVGEYSIESGALIDEKNEIFIVKKTGSKRFYRLRSTGEEKLKITSIRLQGDNVLINYETVN
jgi:hypothetical protein